MESPQTQERDVTLAFDQHLERLQFPIQHFPLFLVTNTRHLIHEGFRIVPATLYSWGANLAKELVHNLIAWFGLFFGQILRDCVPSEAVKARERHSFPAQSLYGFQHGGFFDVSHYGACLVDDWGALV